MFLQQSVVLRLIAENLSNKIPNMVSEIILHIIQVISSCNLNFNYVAVQASSSKNGKMQENVTNAKMQIIVTHS